MAYTSSHSPKHLPNAGEVAALLAKFEAVRAGALEQLAHQPAPPAFVRPAPPAPRARRAMRKDAAFARLRITEDEVRAIATQKVHGGFINLAARAYAESSACRPELAAYLLRSSIL